MPVTRTFTGYRPVAVSPDRQTRALTHFAVERLTGIDTDTVDLTNQPVAPIRVELNGRVLDIDSDPAECVVVDKTLTFLRALVATDVLTVLHHYRQV